MKKEQKLDVLINEIFKEYIFIDPAKQSSLTKEELTDMITCPILKLDNVSTIEDLKHSIRWTTNLIIINKNKIN